MVPFSGQTDLVKQSLEVRCLKGYQLSKGFRIILQLRYVFLRWVTSTFGNVPMFGNMSMTSDNILLWVTQHHNVSFLYWVIFIVVISTLGHSIFGHILRSAISTFGHSTSSHSSFHHSTRFRHSTFSKGIQGGDQHQRVQPWE